MSTVIYTAKILNYPLRWTRNGDEKGGKTGFCQIFGLKMNRLDVIFDEPDNTIASEV